jgi:probable addiction module antidote protein
MIMALKTYPFDTSEYVDSPEAELSLLADAVETGDANYIAHALGVIARARGMTSIAKEAGVTREALYRALIEDDGTKLTTLMGVLKSLGVKLNAEAAE